MASIAIENSKQYSGSSVGKSAIPLAAREKIYFMEFLDGSGSVVDTFGFSMPPQTESLSHPMRKAEARTFGGMHIDDYGRDSTKITLTGTTGSRRKKLIHSSGGDGKWASGEEEILELQRKILKHKSAESVRSGARIVLYDLSKSESADLNAWIFSPDEVRVSRDAGKPFTYNYSITGTLLDAAKPIGGVKSGFVNLKSGGLLSGAPLGKIKGVDALGALRSVLSGENAAYKSVVDKLRNNKWSDWMETVSATVGDAYALLSEAEAICDDFINAAWATVDATTGAMNAVASGVADLAPSVTEKFTNLASKLSSKTRASAAGVRKMCESFAELGAGGYWQSVAAIWNDKFADGGAEAVAWDAEASMWKNISVNSLCDRQNSADIAAAMAISPAVVDVPIPFYLQKTIPLTDSDGAPLLDGAGNPMTAKVYVPFIDMESGGKVEVFFKDGMSLEEIAKKYLGDAGRAGEILAANGATDEKDLKPGDKIIVPAKAGGGAAASVLNNIIAPPEKRDPYGVDIAVDEAGAVACRNGDFAFSSGAENLSQAVLLRLRESSEKRVRLGVYGIKQSFGDAQAAQNYIVASIVSSIAAEPRVKSVDGVRFEGSADGLWVEVDYTDLTGGGGKARGML